MTCTISITEAYGLTNSDGDLTAIVVQGTATDCDTVVLTIQVGSSDYRQISVTVSSGSWTGTFLSSSYPDEWPWHFRCGDLIRVLAACKSDWSCLDFWSDELECRETGDCPTVTWGSPNYSDCNDDGTRTVTVTVILNSGSGDAITADLRLDGSTVDSGTSSGSLELTLNEDLEEGSYLLSLEITTPEGCDADQLELVVRPCGCPDITLDYDVSSECNDDGTTTVTLSARRNDSGDHALVVWDKFGDETVTDGYGKIIYGSGDAYTVEWDYEPGTYEAMLRIVDPEDCTNLTIEFEVPECEDELGGCPKIGVVSFVATECNKDGTRTVALVASAPASGTATVAWDFLGDGTEVDAGITLTSSSSAYVVTHDYEPGTYTAVLNFGSPEGCDPIEETFVVLECDGEPSTPGGSEATTSGGCLKIVCAALGTLLAIAVFLAIIGFFIGLTALSAGSGAAILVLTPIIVAACGWCEWAKWVVYGVLAALIVMVLLYTGGIPLPAWLLSILGEGFSFAVLDGLLAALGSAVAATTAMLIGSCKLSSLWTF